MAAGEIDDLANLEITGIHSRVDSFDGGDSYPISISDAPEGIIRFNLTRTDAYTWTDKIPGRRTIYFQPLLVVDSFVVEPDKVLMSGRD